jgi:tetratricopeptide (TPR) repeat protein
MEMKKVFISYSHDSEEHAAKVLAFSNKLIESGGIDCILDQYNPNPPEGWPRWMDAKIIEADFVLMVCTETYYNRVCMNELPDKGFGVAWEGNLIYNHFYKGKAVDHKFIPVLFNDASAAHIPTPFSGKTNFRIDTEVGYQLLYRELTDQPLVLKPELNPNPTHLPPRNVESHSTATPKPQHISLSRLPDTSGLLFGREAELKLLDEAWENPHTHVVSFVAQGGEGKTALTRKWVNNMEKDGFRGAERVYAWSFYSQGTSEDRQVSADLFLAETLTWFGDAAMANSPASARQKAQRLATLVRQQKTLLILDGVEPLQYPLGEPHNGRMRDEGIKVLLKELANTNSGLCVVSTRQEVRELKDGLVLQQPLSPLSNSAGADLLAELGVKGPRKELEATAKEYHGHALALTLLGNLLREYHDGDIRQRDVIPPLEDEDEWGSHAKRVLGSYAKLLEGKPELGILRIMSLFDRPADMTVVNELRKDPAIPSITEALVGLSELEWKRACKHLRDLGMLEEGNDLDCHPLIREHFALELSREHEEAWKKAHRRLYEYYRALPEKELPDTLEEMEPLYRAMGHGCKAERYEEAFYDLFVCRINRGNEAYAIFQLAAFSTNLSALENFFSTHWHLVNPKLQKKHHESLLNSTGFCLRAIGRLREAADPMKVALKLSIGRKNWGNASKEAKNICELLLITGELFEAVLIGRDAIKYGGICDELNIKTLSYAALGNAKHQKGQLTDSERLFRKAEEIQKQSNSNVSKLYLLPGYQFCDLLLTKGNWEEVIKRAKYMIENVAIKHSRLDNTLTKFILHRALLVKLLNDQTDDFDKAKESFDRLVEDLRKVARMDYLPLGLLARATIYRKMNQFSLAQQDLSEVLEIADPEMRLHLTDYHLESARLCLAMGGKHPEAQDHYEKAKKLVDDTGYHRRDKEVEELRVKLEAEHLQKFDLYREVQSEKEQNRIDLGRTSNSTKNDSPFTKSKTLLDSRMTLKETLDYNHDAIRRLVEQLHSPRRVIPFVGAGLSMTFGFKSWKDYLLHHAEAWGIKDDIDALLKNDAYEEAASLLQQAMGTHAFGHALENDFGPHRLASFKVNKALSALPHLSEGPVITTNYDHILEKAFLQLGQPFSQIAVGAMISATQRAVEKSAHALFKLHGDATEESNRILTLKEYAQHYGDVGGKGFDQSLPLPKILMRLMSNTPLLFIGCSLSADRTLKLLAEITEKLSHGGHYAIVALPANEADLPKRKQHFSKHYITPIWYDARHGHGMVEELLEYLASTMTLTNRDPVDLSPAPPNRDYDLGNIIRLVSKAFDPVGFETFVLVNFSDIHGQFPPGMVQEARINLLVTRVSILGKMEAMLEGIKIKNVHQFKACGPYWKP